MPAQMLLPTATCDESRTRSLIGRPDFEAPDLTSSVLLEELDHQASGCHLHAYVRTDPKARAIEPATLQAQIRCRRWFRLWLR
jgi:hypothetical protein